MSTSPFLFPAPPPEMPYLSIRRLSSVDRFGGYRVCHLFGYYALNKLFPRWSRFPLVPF